MAGATHYRKRGIRLSTSLLENENRPEESIPDESSGSPQSWDGLQAETEQVLRRLQIGGRLNGFHYLTYAIMETVKKPDLVRDVVKGLYVDTAFHCGSSASCVERSTRTAILRCWDSETGRAELDKVAGYHVIQRPVTSEFIDLVAAYIRTRYCPSRPGTTTTPERL